MSFDPKKKKLNNAPAYVNISYGMKPKIKEPEINIKHLNKSFSKTDDNYYYSNNTSISSEYMTIDEFTDYFTPIYTNPTKSAWYSPSTAVNITEEQIESIKAIMEKQQTLEYKVLPYSFNPMHQKPAERQLSFSFIDD